MSPRRRCAARSSRPIPNPATGSSSTLTVAKLGRGQASTAEWNWLLAPGESRALEFRVPFVTIDTEAERKKIAGLDFNRVLATEADRWRKIIAQQAGFEVPDPLLTDFYKANLAHVLITADRDPGSGRHMLPAGTLLYGVCLNESCHQIRALEMRGLHDEAQKYLDSYVAAQSEWGMNGRFTEKTGVLGGGGPYNLDHGFGLWMLNEHYRFTRDRDWLARTAPALIAACDFVTRQRNRPPALTCSMPPTFVGESGCCLQAIWKTRRSGIAGLR